MEILEENVTGNLTFLWPLWNGTSKKIFVLKFDVFLAIEDIRKRRQPYPSLDAIYFMSPTEVCVNRIIEDFSGPKAFYSGAHLYFISSNFY
jgi:syntaxin-binding protein 1